MDAHGAPRIGASSILGLSAESVLDANPNPVLAVDRRGLIVYANAKAAEAFGWSPEDLLGMPVERLVPEPLRKRHAVERAAFGQQPVARPMGSGLELSALRRDGTGFPVEISLTVLATRRGPLTIATIVDITERSRLEAQLGQAHGELLRHAQELEERERVHALMSELAELLQSCQTVAEAYGVAGGIAGRLFAGDAGALYALGPSPVEAVAVASWGTPAPERSAFPPADCWALRRGRLHVVHAGKPEVRCPHVDEPIGTGLLCMPLTAQTDTLGLLHVQLRRQATGSARDALLAEREQLVRTLGEQLALSLANIRLRATLREQSSRDPLTGLFNRRSLEDALERELRRAAREGYGLGLLLADLDHFKALNDAFGHAAGDSVLREVGHYLLRAVRGADVACRFGGEEFVVLLPKASLDDTRRRAEELRNGFSVQPQDATMRRYPTTMSIGVAAYPLHGTTAEELLHAADRAMYRAKELGRDRVEVASGSESLTIEVASE